TLESNRVDIGLFVYNGTYYSAPGFVTICSLDREARVYSKEGKLLSIAHGMGEAEIRVKDWSKVLTRIHEDSVRNMFPINKTQKDGLLEGILHLKQRHIFLVSAQTTLKEA